MTRFWTNVASLARQHRVAMVIFTVASVLLGLHALYYYPFMADDSFISLRYSQRLLEGHGLTWSPGKPVEGYSNLLWVLLCALLGWMRLELTLAARILGCLSSAATVAAVVYATAPVAGARRRDAAPSWVSALIVAASGSMAAWTVGGLEQPLMAALLAWTYAMAIRHVDGFAYWGRKRQTAIGVLLGLVAWTRPDGLIFSVTLLLSLWWVGVLSVASWRRLARIAVIPAGFYGLQLAFRIYYYGEWVANTAHAKLAWTKARHVLGMKYLWDGTRGLLPVLLLAAPLLVAGFRSLAFAKRLIVLLTAIIAWSVYLVLVGGDLFPAHRHLVPLVPLSALLVGQATRFMCSLRNPLRWAWLTLCATALTIFLGLQRMDEDNAVAHGELWEWQAVPVGRLLRSQFESKGAVLAADSAGSLVYYAHLPAIDMLGLNDHFIAHHPPPTLGEGTLGHELGDGQYVLDRRPDLVIFLFPTGASGSHWRSGKQMLAQPRFALDYRHAILETDDPDGIRCEMFIRRRGRIGFVEDRYIVVPGYLLSGEGETVARLNEYGQLGVVLRKGQPARIDQLPLGGKRWRLTVQSSGEPLVITTTCGERSSDVPANSTTLGDCAEPGTWSVALQPTGEGLSHVSELRFEPLSEQ